MIVGVDRLRARQEWVFFTSLHHADRRLAAAWWALLALRGVLPAAFAVTLGVLVGAVERADPLPGPLAATAVVFVLMQVLHPLHLAVSAALGDRTAAWLYDRLGAACVGPPGIGHLEDPQLAADLTVAREFDAAMTAPPLFMSMDFIADGLVGMLSGLAAACILFGFAWWAPPVLVAGWLATHWMMRESGVWRDRNTDEVRSAQREAEYAYRLAVDPPAAKELRLFGLQDWVLERFGRSRHTLHRLQYEATRLRERPVLLSLAVTLAANLAVLLVLGESVVDGRTGLGAAATYALAAVGASAIAFGGFNWALDGAAAPVAAVLSLEAAMAPVGALQRGDVEPAASAPAREIRFRDVTFAYPAGGVPVLEHFDLTIPAGTSLAIVGQNGAGKTTLAKLLCRLYDPQAGTIEIDGTDLRQLDVDAWRARVTTVFQDFVRYEASLGENVAPNGASAAAIEEALERAGADDVVDRTGGGLDTILAKGYPGGTELSGGQWQRVALARALCAVGEGAGLVLLDEPTAQLDVRGEAEIFARLLAATRGRTTILISHRFSTVRHADRICVLEHGRVVELGTHDELLARGGRYATMFRVQAQRFAVGEVEEGEEETVFDVLT